MAWYAQYLSSQIKLHATVVSYLSGVKILHVLLKLEVKQFSCILLRLTMRGLRCKSEHAVDRLGYTPTGKYQSWGYGTYVVRGLLVYYV